jgi:hypothetical protein
MPQDGQPRRIGGGIRRLAQSVALRCGGEDAAATARRGCVMLWPTFALIVTLSPSLVILSGAKDLRIALRVNCAKGPFHFEMLRFFACAQNDKLRTAPGDGR